MKARLFIAVLLLSVTAVSTAGSNSTSSNKNAPTVEALNEGYCYFSKNKLFDSLAKSSSNSGLLVGRFEHVQKSWCDSQGGVLFRPDDCRKKLGFVCIEAKDNDNIMMVIKVYGMKRKGGKREEKEVIEAVQQALIELELYQGLVDGVVGPETKAAINQWLKNQGKPPLQTIEPPPTPASAVDNGIDGTWSGRTKGCKWGSGKIINEHLQIFVVDRQITSLNFNWSPRNKRIKASIGSKQVLTVSASVPPHERIRFSGKLVNNGATLRGRFGSGANYCAINLTRIPPPQKISPKVSPTVVITKALVDDITTAAQAEKARQAELARIETEKKAEGEKKPQKETAPSLVLKEVEAERERLTKQLASQILDLQKAHTRLKEDKSALKGKYEEIEAERDQLALTNAELIANKKVLEKAVQQLKSDYKLLQDIQEQSVSSESTKEQKQIALQGLLQKLVGDYKLIQAERDQLASDYSDLMKNKEVLEQALQQRQGEQEKFRALEAEHNALLRDIAELVPDLEDKRRARKLAALEAIQQLAQAYKVFLADFIATHILTDTATATALIPLMKEYESALAEAEPGTLDQLNTTARDVLDKHGLGDEIAKIEATANSKQTEEQSTSIAENKAVAERYKIFVEKFISENIVTNTETATGLIPLLQILDEALTQSNNAVIESAIKTVDVAIGKYGLAEKFADSLIADQKDVASVNTGSSETSSKSKEKAQSGTGGLVLSLSSGSSESSSGSGSASVGSDLSLGSSSGTSGLNLGGSSALTLSGTSGTQSEVSKTEISQEESTTPTITSRIPSTKAGKNYAKFSRYWRKIQSEYFSLLRQAAENDIALSFASIKGFKEFDRFHYFNTFGTGKQGTGNRRGDPMIGWNRTISFHEYGIGFQDLRGADRQFGDGYGQFWWGDNVPGVYVIPSSGGYSATAYSPLNILGTNSSGEDYVVIKRSVSHGKPIVLFIDDIKIPVMTFVPSCLYQQPIPKNSKARKTDRHWSISGLGYKSHEACHWISNMLLTGGHFNWERSNARGEHGFRPPGLALDDVGRFHSRRQYPHRVIIRGKEEFADIYALYLSDLSFQIEQAKELFPFAEDVLGENEQNIALSFGEKQCAQLGIVKYFNPDYIDRLRAIGALSSEYILYGESVISLIELGGLDEYSYCEKLVNQYDSWKEAVADALNNPTNSKKTLKSLGN